MISADEGQPWKLGDEKKKVKIESHTKIEKNHKMIRYTNMFSKEQKKVLLIVETVLPETDRKELSSAKKFWKPHKSTRPLVIAGPENIRHFTMNRRWQSKLI